MVKNNNKNTRYLTLDIGGTFIKYSVMDGKKAFIFKDKTPSRIYEGGESLVKKVYSIIQETKKNHPIEGVAISSTGIVDSISGRIVYADDVMEGYTGRNYTKDIQDKFSLRASASNDVNCLALSQVPYNKGTDFVVVAIGTGIGGASVINDKVYEGYGFSAGEFGLMHIREGKNWEALCSVSALVKAAKEARLNVSNGKELFDLYDEEDELALEIVDNFNKDMANGISNLIYAFAPRKIILGGGISSRKEKLVTGIKKYLGIMMDSYYFAKTNIECAKYENDAAMIGALEHFFNVYER